MALLPHLPREQTREGPSRPSSRRPCHSPRPSDVPSHVPSTSPRASPSPTPHAGAAGCSAGEISRAGAPCPSVPYYKATAEHAHVTPEEWGQAVGWQDAGMQSGPAPSLRRAALLFLTPSPARGLTVTPQAGGATLVPGAASRAAALPAPGEAGGQLGAGRVSASQI